MAMKSDRQSLAGHPRPLLAAVFALVATIILLYSVLIAQQLLLGLLVVGSLLGAYFAYRLLVAVERLADAAQRLAVAFETGER